MVRGLHLPSGPPFVHKHCSHLFASPESKDLKILLLCIVIPALTALAVLLIPHFVSLVTNDLTLRESKAAFCKSLKSSQVGVCLRISIVTPPKISFKS